jgi:hypothetical protein
MQRNAPIRNEKHPNGIIKMTDITDAGPRLKAMNDRLEELRTAADRADAEYRAEIDRLRLTDAERKAITEASDFYVGTRTGVTLRGLLERTLSNVASDFADMVRT